VINYLHNNQGYTYFVEKKKQKQNVAERLYTLFILEPDGTVEVLNEFKTASKDWGVQLWPEIDAYFILQQDSGEKRRQQLMQEIQQLEFELKQRRAELAALERVESDL
jgi:hypothetical protein